ncbi:hypothetical protein GCM10007209_07820 [Haloferax sulfurifontis]|uniref:Uncharacterized protein n=1 Tax=Haloferax sulfurifontis TaxID=255616 RepID=A0A830E759_9EURY|nr:hypothetical protein GCM10007209_07820 [Haloferax sulfurifontis]
MNERNLAVVTHGGEVTRRGPVHGSRQLGIRLTAVHVSVGGAVDDDINVVVPIEQRYDPFGICDIDLVEGTVKHRSFRMIPTDDLVALLAERPNDDTPEQAVSAGDECVHMLVVSMKM